MHGSIRKRGDAWVADITIRGKRKTKTFRLKSEASEWLAAQRVDPSGRAPAPFSLAQAKELSARVRWTDRQTGQPRAYYRTAMIYCDSALTHFGEACLVSEITAPQVMAWMEGLLDAGNAPATVNRKLSALKAMLRDAASHGHLDPMPHLPQQLSLRNARNRTISDSERVLLVRALIAMGEPAAADFLELLLETAARFGEANRLKGSDVDLARRTVTFWQTKSGRPRTVPLTQRAVECLRSYVPANPSHRLWPFEYRRFKMLFDRAKAAAGPGLADDPSLNIHCSRHTCATKLAAKGVPLHQIMSFGGWTSLASVQRYLHLQTDALAGCVAALEG